MQMNWQNNISNFYTVQKIETHAYPCQSQCSLFTHIAADPQFPRFNSLAEIFAENIKAVVTSCTCQEEKQTNKQNHLIYTENQYQAIMKNFYLISDKQGKKCF